MYVGWGSGFVRKELSSLEMELWTFSGASWGGVWGIGFSVYITKWG